jgi:hypothetical protein
MVIPEDEPSTDIGATVHRETCPVIHPPGVAMATVQAATSSGTPRHRNAGLRLLPDFLDLSRRSMAVSTQTHPPQKCGARCHKWQRWYV